MLFRGYSGAAGWAAGLAHLQPWRFSSIIPRFRGTTSGSRRAEREPERLGPKGPGAVPAPCPPLTKRPPRRRGAGRQRGWPASHARLGRLFGGSRYSRVRGSVGRPGPHVVPTSLTWRNPRRALPALAPANRDSPPRTALPQVRTRRRCGRTGAGRGAPRLRCAPSAGQPRPPPRGASPGPGSFVRRRDAAALGGKFLCPPRRLCPPRGAPGGRAGAAALGAGGGTGAPAPPGCPWGRPARPLSSPPPSPPAAAPGGEVRERSVPAGAAGTAVCAGRRPAAPPEPRPAPQPPARPGLRAGGGTGGSSASRTSGSRGHVGEKAGERRDRLLLAPSSPPGSWQRRLGEGKPWKLFIFACQTPF